MISPLKLILDTILDAVNPIQKKFTHRRKEWLNTRVVRWMYISHATEKHPKRMSVSFTIDSKSIPYGESPKDMSYLVRSIYYKGWKAFWFCRKLAMLGGGDLVYDYKQDKNSDKTSRKWITTNVNLKSLLPDQSTCLQQQKTPCQDKT